MVTTKLINAKTVKDHQITIDTTGVKLKPKREEVLDAIIRTVFDNGQVQLKQVADAQRAAIAECHRLEQLRDDKALDIKRFDALKRKLEHNINVMLAAEGFAPVNVVIGGRKRSGDTDKDDRVYPIVHIDSSKGKDYRAYSTTQLNKKLDTAIQHSNDLAQEVSRLHNYCRQWDIDNLQTGSRTDLRTRVMQRIMETDPTMVTALTNAVERLTVPPIDKIEKS